MSEGAEPLPPTASLAPGVAVALSPLVRRIVANNPGFMTGPGTNTYLVGIDEIAVVDPGPDDPDHIDAIVGCGGDRIRWILPTHTHLDHSPGVKRLKKHTGAEVLAIEERDDLEVDEIIRDGFRLEATEFRLRAVHTPGHASNHTCWYLEEEQLLFSGDHVMQGSTVVIAPPDGDMAVYLESLEKARKLRLRAIAPGHGLVIDEPKAAIDDYLAHRRDREKQVLAAVKKGGSVTIDELVQQIYGGEIPEPLLPVAAQTTWAHLLKLRADKAVTGKSFAGRWRVK
jgi:glyoxylase-like metal-dependent hydrolase (beta-lactamase superfamily II)